MKGLCSCCPIRDQCTELCAQAGEYADQDKVWFDSSIYELSGGISDPNTADFIMDRPNNVNPREAINE